MAVRVAVERRPNLLAVEPILVDGKLSRNI